MSKEGSAAGRGGKFAIHRRDITSVSQGEVSFTFPEALTADDYTDILAWMEIVQRKLKRFVTDEAGRSAISSGEKEN